MLVLALSAGLLIPFVIGFTEIVVRSALHGQLEATLLTLLSFALLGGGYILGYRALWHWLVRNHRFENPFLLLRLGTFTVMLSALTQFFFLFQAGNMTSNLAWLAFFVITSTFFYLIGRMQINRQ